MGIKRIEEADWKKRTRESRKASPRTEQKSIAEPGKDWIAKRIEKLVEEVEDRAYPHHRLATSFPSSFAANLIPLGIVSAFLIAEEKEKKNKGCLKVGMRRWRFERIQLSHDHLRRCIFYGAIPAYSRPVCTGDGVSKGEFFSSVWANLPNGWKNRRKNNHRPVIKLPPVREPVKCG